MKSFKELNVYQDSITFVTKIYGLTSQFPKSELFGITNQIRRSAVSIPSNIAEGSGRSSGKEFARFLEFSLGSAYELETQLIIAEKRKYIKQCESGIILEELISLQKRISGLSNSMVK